MNPEQLLFVESCVETCCLMGIPGGGKTKCIIEYIINKIIKKIFLFLKAKK